jgi:flagellar protein FliO/FliZ
MGSVELVGRVLVSLVVVLAIVWVLGRKFRKGGKAKGEGLIDVLGRQQLSRTASVAVVRIGSQALIVGITDTQVNVLGETDLMAALAETAVPAPAATARRVAGPAATPVAANPTTAIPTTAHPTTARPTTAGPVSDGANRRGPLAGSALSPATWRQTIESLRDLSAH